jgi:hypothetical protein
MMAALALLLSQAHANEQLPPPASKQSEEDIEATSPEPVTRGPPPPVVDTRLVVEAGASTRGGLAPGARIIHVTSLEDDGKGTIRWALRKPCPCVIVFDVAGMIDLKSDLRIAKPFVTIAGQTAPYPGIFAQNCGEQCRGAALVDYTRQRRHEGWR